jgi:hypothetical protein
VIAHIGFLIEKFIKNFVPNIFMKVGNIENGLGSAVIAAMKDGSYVPIPTQRVIHYDNNSRSKAWGVGVQADHLVRELQEMGNVHIAKDLNPEGPYDVLEVNDIVEIYTAKIHEGKEPIVQPKTGLRKALWRLSML